MRFLAYASRVEWKNVLEKMASGMRFAKAANVHELAHNSALTFALRRHAASVRTHKCRRAIDAPVRRRVVAVSG